MAIKFTIIARLSSLQLCSYAFGGCLVGLMSARLNAVTLGRRNAQWPRALCALGTYMEKHWLVVRAGKM